MNKEEWIARYKARVIQRCQEIDGEGVNPLFAQITAEIGYDEMYAEFKDDPEEAADEEMSNWD